MVPPPSSSPWPTALLAIGVTLMAGGNFGVLGSILDRRGTIAGRFGRLIRNGFTATLGFGVWILAVINGAKPGLAFPAMVGGLAVGTIAALFHQAMLTRRYGKTLPDDPPKPS